MPARTDPLEWTPNILGARSATNSEPNEATNPQGGDSVKSLLNLLWQDTSTKDLEIWTAEMNEPPVRCHRVILSMASGFAGSDNYLNCISR